MKIAIVVFVVAASAAPLDTSKAIVTVSVAGFSSDTAAVTLGATGISELQIEEAWVTFKNLRFPDAESCQKSSAAPHVRGPVVAELVSGKVTGLPEQVSMHAGQYCGVELTLRRSTGKVGAPPGALRGHSILVRAHRADGTRVILQSRLDRALWLAAVDDAGFPIRADGAHLVLAADVAAWFDGLDVSTADTTMEDGREVVHIDEHRNRELLDAFETHVPEALALYEDRDRNGALDEGEREARRKIAVSER